MLENRKNVVGKGKCFGVLLTDLFKVFKSLSHELLIEKLHACGFDLPAPKLIQSYLSVRQKSIRRVFHGRKFYLEYRKDLFLVFCCLIFLCVTYFRQFVKLTLYVMLTIMSSNHFMMISYSCLNDF